MHILNLTKDLRKAKYLEWNMRQNKNKNIKIITCYSFSKVGLLKEFQNELN